MSWDPKQYLAFAGPRMQPAIDLLARIGADAPGRVVDLGCGPGNITPLLRARWPAAALVGIDNSESMLARAREAVPDARFEAADIHRWTPDAAPDVIYSNAALQWLDNHETLFPHLADLLADGGTLAVQMPRNFGAPSHTLMLDTVRDGPWRERLERHWTDEPTKDPEFYYKLLAPRARRLDLWETIYVQVLDGENPVAEYTKGTWLRRFLDPLEEPERSRFEAAYRARVKSAYPPQADGKTLFPFKRLFILAQF